MNARRFAPLALVVSLGCSSSEGEAVLEDTGSALEDSANEDSAIADSRVEDSAAGDSATEDSADASLVDSASDAAVDATKEAAADGSVEAGPGPAPAGGCTYTKDADGFFKLTSPKSDYIVRLPPAYDVASPKPFPLLVSLHGCGDTALNHANWSAVPYGAMRTSQNYIAVSMGGREGGCWSIPGDVPLVMAAITHVRSCFYVHQKRIVVGGYSSGGQLAYNIGFTNAAMFAGILIQNSSLTDGVGGESKVSAAIAAADWKINVAHSARLSDTVFPIARVHADRDKMLAGGIPLVYREIAGTHTDVDGDWEKFLLPKLTGWYAP